MQEKQNCSWRCTVKWQKIHEAKIAERSKIRQTLFHSLFFPVCLSNSVSVICFCFCFFPTGWTTTLGRYRYDFLFWAISSVTWLIGKLGAYLSVKLNLASVQLVYNLQTVKSPVDMTLLRPALKPLRADCRPWCNAVVCFCFEIALSQMRAMIGRHSFSQKDKIVKAIQLWAHRRCVSLFACEACK